MEGGDSPMLHLFSGSLEGRSGDQTLDLYSQRFKMWNIHGAGTQTQQLFVSIDSPPH